ncbi:hypothetical protein Clacol_008709 [Clathrus columnatus]|uniref:Clavaminate synthase-like protein n=1 Tax=Clathrus columnatus TaxID=1419009 RepID=A0AAV5AJ96_9AGAM|nr:hypothetical protein Clacol_008709 [Clathrus columnatus]
MPTATVPEVPRYNLPPTTTCELDWADLPFVDLSKTQTPEGRIELVKQVQNALSTTGFFYVINHGYSAEQVSAINSRTFTPSNNINSQTQRLIDIGDIPFTQVNDEEKAEYENKPNEAGTYLGYKPRSYWHIENGVRDQIDQYNTYGNVLHSYPHSEADIEKTKNLWLKGHTDFGSLTMLWSQPVSALQIRSPDGKWRWVKHVENAVIINAGDWLEVYSAGYYKATIHRVVQPPPDQRQYNRLGLYCFVVPNDDARLTPNLDAPLLKRIGFNEFYKGEQFVPGPTMKEFRIGRTSTYGQVKLKKGATEGTEESVVAGVTVTHYL